MRVLLDDAARAAALGTRAAEYARERWTARASVDRLEAHIFRTVDRARAARSDTAVGSS